MLHTINWITIRFNGITMRKISGNVKQFWKQQQKLRRKASRGIVHQRSKINFAIYSARQAAMSVRNLPWSSRLHWMKRRPLERMTRAVKLPHPPNSGERSKINGIERSEHITVWGRMRALRCFTDNWSPFIDPLSIFLSRDFTHNSERNKSIYSWLFFVASEYFYSMNSLQARLALYDSRLQKMIQI